MTRRSTIATGAALGLVLFAAGAFGLARSRSTSETSPRPDAGSIQTIPSESLDDLIVDLQDRLEAAPKDYVSWATLAIAYVQQAKATVNPDYYPRAEGAIEKSLELNMADNFLAYAAASTLASARHDFASAKADAERGLAINEYSSILYGALGDAEIQLGNYEAAFAAVQQMVDLSPDAASLARASYTWELRGDVDRAQELMQRAFVDAPNPAIRAFALVHLGELAFDSGDPGTALGNYRAALVVAPDDPAALAGAAKAEAALGQTETALDDYARLVLRFPEPSYLLEYAELLQSLGRDALAAEQFVVFEATQAIFAANGVAPDAAAALYEANHGDPTLALAHAEAGIASRPFLVMYDAYAWALHRNGRDDEALVAIERALQLGTRNASLLYHAGMIELALGNLDTAREHLRSAISINPHFSPIDAPRAKQALAELERS